MILKITGNKYPDEAAWTKGMGEHGCGDKMHKKWLI